MMVTIKRPHTCISIESLLGVRHIKIDIHNYTVELPNNGHIGSGPFVLYIEVVPL